VATSGSGWRTVGDSAAGTGAIFTGGDASVTGAGRRVRSQTRAGRNIFYRFGRAIRLGCLGFSRFHQRLQIGNAGGSRRICPAHGLALGKWPKKARERA